MMAATMSKSSASSLDRMQPGTAGRGIGVGRVGRGIGVGSAYCLRSGTSGTSGSVCTAHGSTSPLQHVYLKRTVLAVPYQQQANATPVKPTEQPSQDGVGVGKADSNVMSREHGTRRSVRRSGQLHARSVGDEDVGRRWAASEGSGELKVFGLRGRGLSA